MTSSHSFRLRILRSGSSGNAIFLEAAGTRLIIDVGLPAEVMARERDSIPGPSPITAILLTHEPDDLLARARDADALILEANYDLRLLSVSPYPWFLKNRILSPTGHLSNDAAARAVVEVASDRPQTVFLVHLSDINNLTPLARDTVQWALEREGIAAVRVEAVRPNGTSPLWEMQ